jgi:hypothetical protein
MYENPLHVNQGKFINLLLFEDENWPGTFGPIFTRMYMYIYRYFSLCTVVFLGLRLHFRTGQVKKIFYVPFAQSRDLDYLPIHDCKMKSYVCYCYCAQIRGICTATICRDVCKNNFNLDSINFNSKTVKERNRHDVVKFINRIAVLSDFGLPVTIVMIIKNIFAKKIRQTNDLFSQNTAL